MELEEILSLSDRILVMYEGKSMGEFENGELTIEEMGLMMAGKIRRNKSIGDKKIICKL